MRYTKTTGQKRECSETIFSLKMTISVLSQVKNILLDSYILDVNTIVQCVNGKNCKKYVLMFFSEIVVAKTTNSNMCTFVNTNIFCINYEIKHI